MLLSTDVSVSKHCFLVITACLICLSENNPCIKHYHIKETNDNPKRYYVAEKYVFDSIPILINYHQHNGGGEFSGQGQRGALAGEHGEK